LFRSRDHSNVDGFAPVGYATAARSTDKGLEMTFKIGETADGDKALVDVQEGIRDALSVELIETRTSGDALTAGTLTAVALVPIPAFSEARVSEIYAALSDLGDDVTPITDNGIYSEDEEIGRASCRERVGDWGECGGGRTETGGSEQ